MNNSPYPINHTFGFLTVVSASSQRTKRHISKWKCLCICGKMVLRTLGDIKRRPTSSCGCQHKRLASEANKTHGFTCGQTNGRKRPTEYTSWANMIARCTNKKHPRYKDYGGRGIKVCKRWCLSFAAFITDMGMKPTPQHTIERRDNSKGYSPTNCRWATKQEQNYNTRCSHFVTFQDQTLTIAQWSEKTGISKSLLSFRIRKGWPVELALTSMPNRHKKLKTLLKSVHGQVCPMVKQRRKPNG